MSQAELPELRPTVMGMRLIQVVLVLGVLAFLGVSVAIVGSAGPTIPGGPRSLLLLLSVLGVPLLLLQLVLPSMMQSAARSRFAGLPVPEFDRKMLATYRGTSITALALCEAAAFLSVMAFLMFGKPLALTVAAIALLLMIAKFPTVEGAAQWLDQQRERARENHLATR